MTPISRATRVALWLGVAGAPVAAAQGVARPDTAEPILAELRLGHVASRTVAALRVRTEVLLPLTQFLQLAEIRYRVSSTGRLEATVDPGGRRLVIDAGGDTMSYGARRVRLEREYKSFREGELYVGAERLGDLLGSRFVVDFSELTVTMADPGDLPVARRLRREAARTALLRPRETTHPDLLLAAERPHWDGLVFDYTLLAPSGDLLAGSGYTGALGADAFGGSLELVASSVGRAADGVVQIAGSWTGVWRDHRWLEQLRLGDGVSTGPALRALRGVSITNAPFVRPSLIGAERYQGALEPGGGWAVEAYRGGELIAFDSADAAGRFSVQVPVRYGENPVDFVAYGPLGEIREFNQTFRVAEELLPAGRRGVDRFWRATLSDLTHAYASLVGGPSTTWTVTLDGVTAGFARAGLRYEPSIDRRVTAEYTRYAEGTVAPILTPLGARSRLMLFGFWRPIRRAGFFFFDGSFDRQTSLTGTTTLARVESSTEGQAVRALPFVRFERDAPTGVPGATRWFTGASAFVLPRPALGPVLGPIWLRGAVEIETDGPLRLSSYALLAARPVGAGFRVEAGVTWLRGSAGPVLSLSFTSYLAALRSDTTVSAPAGGSVSGTQYVQGSVLWDRATGRLTTAPGPSLERSGVSGRVFLDENADGVRNPGEQGLAGVRVRVGTSTAVSDSDGAFRVWDIVPFEPVSVQVDSLSLSSPLLVPAFASALLEPGPNRFRGLNIPVVRAGVVEGRVSREEGGRRVGVAGVTLQLSDRRRGAAGALRFTTFSDGAFYVLGVTPGDYDLTVDAAVLDALQATAAP